MKAGTLKKLALGGLAVVMIAAAGTVQRSLNGERVRLKLTKQAPIDNMPPVLTLTTVALGGFRGLIANVLWVRANDLQQDEKFFEAVQLADWITKLQPHFTTVWVHQAWNMGYNISVKFPDHKDRWQWVQRAIELLRDEGLKYNPKDTLIYRELAWHFQHKMGNNLDAAHMTYKLQWASEMQAVLGGDRPDWDELINPTTDDARARHEKLMGRYKMDPAFMREVDAKHGPLEWRLPEAHAIYWAELGLKNIEERPPETGRTDDPIVLRRVIYQGLSLAAVRGRLLFSPADKFIEFGPNLAVIPKANAAYEQQMYLDSRFRDNIVNAHKNFLKQTVNDLYIHGREAEAAKLYAYARNRYSDYYPFRLPDVHSYALERTYELVDSAAGRDKMEGLIEAFLTLSFKYEALGEDDRAYGYLTRARQCWKRHQDKVEKADPGRLDLKPMVHYYTNILQRVLYAPPPTGFPDGLKAMLRTARGLPRETNVPIFAASLTNTPPPPSLELTMTSSVERDRKEGEKFLAANRSKPGVFQTDSGLQYRVIAEGRKDGRTPKHTDKVVVHYTGRLLNGSIFDSSSKKGKPVEFDVSGLIKGWTEALKLMKEGAKWELYIPAGLAYGVAGQWDAGVPPNSVLVFEVELIEVKPAGA